MSLPWVTQCVHIGPEERICALLQCFLQRRHQLEGVLQVDHLRDLVVRCLHRLLLSHISMIFLHIFRIFTL